jgi:predicted RNA binding protein YcfA (HicA-like mRNA interferase family)
MPQFGPIKRQKLIQNLRMLGFDGPYSGGNHQFMINGQLKLFIPNPHQHDISGTLLAKILRQANIDRDEWERL